MISDFIKAVSTRAAQADLMQVLVAYLFILAFAMLVSWPTTAFVANDSWYALARTQGVLLMLIGLAFGSASGSFVLPSRAVLLGAVALLASFSVPLEVGSYAASFPDVPLAWSLLLTPLTVVAFFGLGMVLGALLRALKLDILLPLMIPVVMAGVFYIDTAVGTPLLNPFLAATVITREHLLTMSVLTLATVATVLLVDRRTARAAPGEVISA